MTILAIVAPVQSCLGAIPILTFSMTSLAHKTAAVTTAADREIVALTHHGREKYVLMRIEEYEKLSRRPHDPRISGLTAEMPAELRDLFLSEGPGRPGEDVSLVKGQEPYDPSYRPDIISADEVEKG